MNSRVRSVVEMGRRALAFFEAHPDQSLGSLPALSRLKELLARADQLLIQQRDGISEVRAATAEKRDLRRKIRRTHLPHFTRVAEAAAVERPELAGKLELPNEALPYLAFRTAVQGILTEAQKEKDLLLKHGLVEPALESLAAAGTQFDRAVERGLSGRRAHVGARAELEATADEVLQQVRQLDGLVRFHFADDVEARAVWRSASNTIGPPRASGEEGGKRGSHDVGNHDVQPTPPPSTGEIKPAA
ncbi:MAG TPA: hypothetical protein VFH40_06795 [Gemmatimonadales bacterium]|jgi:hypothetical protein|nr:hypothetical protein [Gemmatimonadales bacterium]